MARQRATTQSQKPVGTTNKTKFRLFKTLPSCHVTKALVESLEKELSIIAHQWEGATPSSIANRDVSIIDRYGKETLNCIGDFHSLRFDNTTTRVDLTLNIEGVKSLDIEVTLDRDRGNSEITVNVTSENARQDALSVQNRILQIVESASTLGWIFHPPMLVSLFIYLLAMALAFLPIFYKQLGFSADGWFYYFTISQSTFYGYLLVGSKFKTYTSFDTQTYHRWEWIINLVVIAFIIGVMGSLVASVIYANMANHVTTTKPRPPATSHA